MNSILMTVDELQARLKDPSLKILQVHLAPVGASAPLAEPPHAFIPGARLFDIEAMSDEKSPFPHTALSPDAFASRVRALGIDSDDEIVVYDEKGVYSSPRARDLFLQAGHEKIRVLNGGLPEWLKRGNPTSKQASVQTALGNFSARAPRFQLINQAAVIQAIENKSAVILDARSEERFHGLVDEPRAGLRRGHIPTACSMAFTRVLNGNFLKDPQELKLLFQVMFTHDQKIIVYCGSGVTAGIVALALELAGYAKISVYDGSWSEWGAYP